MNRINDFKLYFFLFIPLLVVIGCLTHKKTTDEPFELQTSPENGRQSLVIEFQKGKSFNYPSFAVWVEDMEGTYIETLYVTNYVAKGEFRYRQANSGKWKNEPGEVRRPATVPYWAHKRNIKAPDGLFVPSPETAVPDALTAATPKNSFKLQTATSVEGNNGFRVLLEINQAWDSNSFWSNNRYPDDKNYFTSLQPALVYAVTVEPQEKDKKFYLNPIGHSHPSGASGELFTDLSTLTTAKEIAEKITVSLR
jgi:hypothetical protein